MVNLVITLEKCNLNSILDSFGIQDRNILITEKTSENIVSKVFRELSEQNKYKPPGIMLSAARSGELKMIDLNDIIYIESYGNLKAINMKNETFEVYGRLYKMAGLVEKFGFIRIHYSYIISLKYIKEAGPRRVRMYDGKIINVGRKFMSAYRAALQNLKENKLN